MCETSGLHAQNERAWENTMIEDAAGIKGCDGASALIFRGADETPGVDT